MTTDALQLLHVATKPQHGGRGRSAGDHGCCLLHALNAASMHGNASPEHVHLFPTCRNARPATHAAYLQVLEAEIAELHGAARAAMAVTPRMLAGGDRTAASAAVTRFAVLMLAQILLYLQ